MGSFYQNLLDTLPGLFVECKAATSQDDDDKDYPRMVCMGSMSTVGADKDSDSSRKRPQTPPPPGGRDRHDELAEFKEVFAHFDRKGTGSIGAEDIREVMRSVGQQPSDDELRDIVNELDLDGNGEIEFHEFLSLHGAVDEEDIKNSFEAFDQDEDGVISGPELKHLMGIFGRDLDERQIKHIINEMDEDGNGAIRYHAFSKMMKQ
mmetsp:Transcript_36526/g.67495  ORF Transcript_36526/g.67495 Transcript_36526/m.67495 type:complete len:206 (-) Transcript_36526:255-872(-)|eukprot:CAMPEP_0170181484 /NCGR_PEP_ID=MMETSP0040_2-20121228/25249_1 /TAXON_ID=641309 /ORGANISM="Lotharella oceanica, Strain CCMP622" /LENGTH=205 /DNA_ID=CAMNT_0010426549 /DNA_START=77 /DNA_END=694 /DNA_ORIENTATION=+